MPVTSVKLDAVVRFEICWRGSNAKQVAEASGTRLLENHQMLPGRCADLRGVDRQLKAYALETGRTIFLEFSNGVFRKYLNYSSPVYPEEL